MSEEIANNLEAQGKNISADMGRQPTICLFVEHRCPDMSHSVYMIKPPVDMPEHGHLIDSEGFMADPESISPVVTFKEKNNFLSCCATVNLGSKIYFLGGKFEPGSDHVKRVQVFDTDHPDQGMRLVAPMNGPKLTPCVFVADDMIYTLGSALKSDADILPGCKGTGVFERYDPCSDCWEVLPDPPFPSFQRGRANFLDRATVVGRRVFIGSSIYVIFNLDNQDWDPFPPSELVVTSGQNSDPLPPSEPVVNFAQKWDQQRRVNSPWLCRRPIIQKVHFPYGSLFVQDSFYHLTGSGVEKPGTSRIPISRFDEPLKVVKRGPVTTTKDRSLLKDPCLDPGKEQIMAQGIDLDENKPFTEIDFFPWRDLFHNGGRFFCYVVTAQLFGHTGHHAHGDPYSRAVLIKFFEEVPAHTDNNIYNKTKFRPLASFCYKITTNFHHSSVFIRCSVLGTVPESWVNAPPLKKKQESKPKLRNKEEDQSFGLVIRTSGQPKFEVENADDLKKLLAVQEEELARKYELLNTYRALLAERGVVIDL